MKLDDRRILSLAYASVFIACTIAYLLASALPAHSAPPQKAYSPFDEPRVRVPKEITEDARLDQKVKVYCKNRNLKDLFSDLSAKSGVKVTVGNEIASQRAVVYFHSRPLRDVMTEISGIYGYYWLVSGKPGSYDYRLFEDIVHSKRKEQVSAMIKAEQDSLLLGFAEKMIDPEREGADEARERLAQTNPDGFRAMEWAGRNNLTGVLANLGIGFLADSLMNGSANVRYADLPLNTQVAICDWYNSMRPSANELVRTEASASGGGAPPVLTPMTPQLPLTPGDLSGDSLTISRAEAEGTGFPRFEVSFTHNNNGSMMRTKTDWPSRSVTEDDLRTATNQPVPEKVVGEIELPDDPKITAEKLRWLPYRKGLLLGDVLEAIAIQSGKDVIADYYLQDKSVAAIKSQPLKQVVESACREFGYTCQVEGETMRFRSNKWYAQDIHTEPPAKMIDSLWSKIEQNGALTVRDMGPITLLSADQMKWVGWAFVPGADVACQWPCTVSMLAGLTESQEKTARNGQLPVSELSDDQNGRLDAMILERKWPVTPEALVDGSLSLSTVKPEISESENGGKVVRFSSSSGQVPPGALSSVAANSPITSEVLQRTLQTAGAGSSSVFITPTASSGNPSAWLQRMGHSQNETLTLAVKNGMPILPISLSIPQPVSEAERKEIAAQRNADREAEKTEVIQ